MTVDEYRQRADDATEAYRKARDLHDAATAKLLRAVRGNAPEMSIIAYAHAERIAHMNVKCALTAKEAAENAVLVALFAKPPAVP